jgi:hypothetical protein
MNNHFNFPIQPSGEISKLFLANNCLDFLQAQSFVNAMKYGRNKNKNNLATIFEDGCGTCSTKHAVLKQLAIELQQEKVKLILGVFLMTKINMPQLANILDKYKLDALPEAHNYLRINDAIVDCTNLNRGSFNLEYEFVTEKEIQPNQIADWKVTYHRNFLQKWLKHQSNINWTLDELWQIRELCILEL